MIWKSFTLVSVSLFLTCGKAHAQEKCQRLNLVLLIDNDVPTPSDISDCAFLIKDSVGRIKDSIPFKYEVGGAIMSDSNYNNLFNNAGKYSISIKFTYFEFGAGANRTHYYKKEHFSRWLNDWYIILKIYNYSNKESRRKYVIQKDGYVMQINSPGGSLITPIWKK